VAKDLNVLLVLAVKAIREPEQCRVMKKSAAGQKRSKRVKKDAETESLSLDIARG